MLTKDQLGFFARNGFLQVPRAVDQDTCAKLVDHTWTRMPQNWSRDDPTTWTGTVTDSCHTGDVRKKHLLKFQKGDLNGNPTIERAFSPLSPMGQIASDLIGHTLKMLVRGLYSILPHTVRYAAAVRMPHVEAHSSHLIALCYLEDVEPNGGGLHVWPGSHRELYPVMGAKMEHVATAESLEVFDRWAPLEPIQCPGHRGDVVIIHHRLLHAPSFNTSKRIRYAFLCDYRREDYLSLCAQKPIEMWEDWPAILELPPDLRERPSDYVLSPQQNWKPPAGSPNPAEKSHEVVRREYASILARARRDGDIWIALSDQASTANEIALFPRGSDLVEAGVTIRFNGDAVSPLCPYDLISRLSVKSGAQRIEISGLDRSAWLRILRVRLPFDNTEMLLRAEVRPGPFATTFSV